MIGDLCNKKASEVALNFDPPLVTLPVLSVIYSSFIEGNLGSAIASNIDRSKEVNSYDVQ